MYWVHPAFKDIFYQVAVKWRGKNYWKVGAMVFNAGFVGKPYFCWVTLKLKLTPEKRKEFVKFDTLEQCYNSLRLTK